MNATPPALAKCVIIPNGWRLVRGLQSCHVCHIFSQCQTATISHFVIMLRKTATFTCTKLFSARKLSTATAPKVSAKGMEIIDPTIGLSEEKTEFYNLARSFADTELRPNAAKWDREAEFPVDTFRKFGELGFGGIFVKEDVGGTALSRADAVSIVEGLATGCVGTTAMLTIHNMCASTIDKFGSDEQRNKWLPDIISMNKLISFCLTEPGK